MNDTYMTVEKKTIYQYLLERDPEQVLFRSTDGAVYTCGQVLKRVEGLAAGLQAEHFGGGKTVALRFPRTAEACIRYFALLTAGVQVYLADPHSTAWDFFHAPEFANMDGYVTDESGTWLLVSPEGKEKGWEEEAVPIFLLPPQLPDAPAILIATSGSTGEKKLVQLSQFNVAANLIDAVHFGDYRKGDLALGILPLFHIFGQALLFGSVMLEYAIVFPEEVSPVAALECVEKYGVTRMNGVPALYMAMAEQAEKYDVSTLRVGFIGGSASSKEEIQRMEDRLGMTLLNSYGMSECISISIGDASETLEKRISGVGRCYPMSEIRIVHADGKVVAPGETGEITVNGASRMLGYYGDEEATRVAIDKDGFLHTGDLGFIDGDGILHIAGRIKEIIIRNGVNISVAHVEAALRSLPEVKQAAVVGVPHKKQGEVPVAVVESAEGEENILAALAKVLPKNELPVKIYAVNKLPLTPSGKLDKPAIKKQLLIWAENTQ